MAFARIACYRHRQHRSSSRRTSVIRPDQRLPDLLQQPDEFLQLALGEIAQELMMQGDQWLIQGSQGRHALVRDVT